MAILPDNAADNVLQRLDGLLSVQEFGSVGDGVQDDTDAIRAAINAAAAINGTLVFPANATYLLSRTVYATAGIRWSFNNTTFLASPLGTYDPVLDNSSADTGLKVFFAVDGGGNSTHHGCLFLDGAGVPNLCGISGNTASGSMGIQYWEWVEFRRFERGIYALNQVHGNTIVGDRFGHVIFHSNGYDIYCEEDGADDAVFDVVRSQGSQLATDANRANIRLEGAWGIVIQSLYLEGQRNDRNGLVIARRSSPIIDHLYIEGTFHLPVYLVDDHSCLTVHDVKVGQVTVSASGQIFEVGEAVETCLLLVAFNSRVLNASHINDLVRLNATSGHTYGRTVIVRLPFAITSKNAIAYTGGVASGTDIVRVHAQGGLYCYYYDGLSVSVIDSNVAFANPTQASGTLGNVSGRMEAFDSAGNSLGFVPIYDSIV